MKALHFLVLGSLLAGPVFAQPSLPWPQTITVTSWGPAEVNEDGNLRFRISASATGILSEVTCPNESELQLWAYVYAGRQPDPTASPLVVQLIKSKDACTTATPPQPAKTIMGTSARFKLRPGTYTYYLFVVLNSGMTLSPLPDTTYTVTATSAPHLGGTVTLP